MKSAFSAALVAAALLLTGCASRQALVPFNDGALASATPSRIGVAMTALPKPDTFFPGANCLLCLASASLANRSLTQHAQTLSSDELAKIKQNLANALTRKGAQAKVIEAPLDPGELPDAKQSGTNVAKKDFSALRAAQNIDKLLVVQVAMVGYVRPYASYFPTSEPKGFVNALGYLVDLRTNTYEWFQPLEITRASDGPWDEAPTFPGLTNAYYQALEASNDELLKPFVAATASTVSAAPATAAPTAEPSPPAATPSAR